MAASTTTASATSLNFVGFEEAAQNGAAPILFNRIYIAPNQPVTAGRHAHATAGFLPDQQPYLKINRDVWNKSRIAQNLRLQGYRRI